MHEKVFKFQVFHRPNTDGASAREIGIFIRASVLRPSKDVIPLIHVIFGKMTVRVCHLGVTLDASGRQTAVPPCGRTPVNGCHARSSSFRQNESRRDIASQNRTRGHIQTLPRNFTHEWFIISCSLCAAQSQSQTQKKLKQ